MNNTNNEAKTTQNLVDKTKEVRAEAKEILAIRFINKMISKITALKTSLKQYQDDKERSERLLKGYQYDYAKNKDEEHPMFEEIDAEAKRRLESAEKEITSENERYQKEITRIEEAIKEKEAKIDSVNNGTIKFKKSKITELTKELLA